MESSISFVSYLIFSVVVLILSVFGSDIFTAIYTFVKMIKKLLIIHLPMRIVKGEILNLIVGKVVLEGKILAVEFYVVIEDNNSRYPKQVKIPKEAFAQLNSNRKFFLNKNISLYFRKNFWGKKFDHLEIA